MCKFPLTLIICLGVTLGLSPPLLAQERSLALSVHTLKIGNLDWREDKSFKENPNRINFELSMKQIYTNSGTRAVGIVFSRTLWFKIDANKDNINDAKVQASISRCDWTKFSRISRPFDWNRSEALVAGENLKVINANFEIRGLPVREDVRQDFGVCLFTWFVELDGTSHWALSASWVISFLRKKGRIDFKPMAPEIVDLFVAAKTQKKIDQEKKQK